MNGHSLTYTAPSQFYCGVHGGAREMARQFRMCTAWLAAEFGSQKPRWVARNYNPSSRISNILFRLLRVPELGIHLHIHISKSR